MKVQNRKWESKDDDKRNVSVMDGIDMRENGAEDK